MVRLVAARSALPSPGFEIAEEKLQSRLPFSQSLKRLLIRLRFARNADRDGVAAFRKNQTMFIRIPKNASTSICRLIYPDTPKSELPGHQSADYYRFAVPNLFERSLVCAALRNPHDRFYSAFNYYKNTTTVPEERHLMDVELSFIRDANDFISYLRDQPDLLSTPIMTWHHFRRQVDFITDARGNVIVDLLFPIEDIDQGIAIVQKHLGFTGVLERRNKSRGPSLDAWPDFLAAHYQPDQELWEQVMAQKVVFPTEKVRELALDDFASTDH